MTANGSSLVTISTVMLLDFFGPTAEEPIVVLVDAPTLRKAER
jgi:hypothetical protein